MRTHLCQGRLEEGLGEVVVLEIHNHLLEDIPRAAGIHLCHEGHSHEHQEVVHCYHDTGLEVVHCCHDTGPEVVHCCHDRGLEVRVLHQTFFLVWLRRRKEGQHC
jgi:hypothetical protein